MNKRPARGNGPGWCLRCKKRKDLFHGYCDDCINTSQRARKKALDQWERWWQEFYAKQDL